MESFFTEQALLSTKRLQEDGLLLRFGIKAVSNSTIETFASTGPIGEPREQRNLIPMRKSMIYQLDK